MGESANLVLAVGPARGVHDGVAWGVHDGMARDVRDGAALAVRALPLRRSPGGREDAVAALFVEHYAGLCRLASLLLDDPQAAEEVVQEAFLATFVGWRRIRHPERAPAYLRAAVVNRCRSRGRHRAVEDRGNRVVWATQATDPPADDAERAGDVLAVLDAVRLLPPRQREAVVLRYYADLSEAEVASALGCSTGTVKSQLSKARSTLAGRLGAESDDAAADAGGSHPDPDPAAEAISGHSGSAGPSDQRGDGDG